jgi:hypothetical protein
MFAPPDGDMIAWVDDLPVAWMVVVIFAGVFLATAAIFFGVMACAVGDRAQAFKAVSPGMLPPMGLVFALIVGFLAAGLWGDVAQARLAVNREASALRSTVLVADAAFPGAPAARMNALVRRQIHAAAASEWPAMARQQATLTVVPAPLAAALSLALRLDARSQGQRTAQRELVTLLDTALDSRRQRIIVSGSTVNWVKWTAVLALAALTLIAIAFVHSGNRRTAAIAMALFASAVAVTLVMIVAQDRPFSGAFGVKPDVLLQVLPPAR